ncbi:hypothetical protein B296_00015552, partial [Ensete ventricosum]
MQLKSRSHSCSGHSRDFGHRKRRYNGSIGYPDSTPQYSLVHFGKAPYRPVCIGPTVDRYTDRAVLSKGDRRQLIEEKIDRRRSISAVGRRLRRNREGKKKKKKKKKRRRRRSEREKVPRVVLARAPSPPSSPAHRHHPWIAREPSPPSP